MAGIGVWEGPDQNIKKVKKRNADWPSTSNLACDHTKNQCISANQISRRIYSSFHDKIEVIKLYIIVNINDFYSVLKLDKLHYHI